jgi:DNA-binding transcriptional LysR family regulator
MLEGTVRIAANELLVAHVLPPLILRSREEHAGLELKLSTVASAHAVARGDVDVALLEARGSDDALSSVRLADQTLQLYAAPGASRELVRCDSELLTWELVKRGVGCGLMLEAVGDAEPRVERLQPNRPVSRECWLVSRRQELTSRAVRAVAALLARELG